MAICSSSSAPELASITNLETVMVDSSNTENSIPGPARWPLEVLDVMGAYLSMFHHQESTCVDSPGGSIGNTKNVPSSLGKEEQEPLLDISNHGPLPHGWEQHLDLRTGQVYYVDWKSCKRSSVDPRKVLKEANEKVSLLISRAQERNQASNYVSDEASECCITSSESSFSSDIWMGDDDDGDDAIVVDDVYRPLPDRANREQADNVDYNNPCLHLFTPCPSPDSITTAHHSNYPSQPFQDDSLLELLACHQCLSRFVTHRANPWCPCCHASLV